MATLADRMNLPFMPWQRQVADVAGELVRDEETGVWIPAYTEVTVTVPRQNGKTLLMLSLMMHRLLVWESWDNKPQLVTYSAQAGTDARWKLRKDFVDVLRPTVLWPAIRRVYQAADNTGFDMNNGAYLKVLSNSESAGHGLTIDYAVLDEIFEDEDDRREQAVGPGMSTRHDAQLLLTSTAGDDTSIFLDRKTTAGRAAVDEGRNRTIAYFEWSADENDDPMDPRVWESCMPALGHTISHNYIQGKAATFQLDEFKRAYLNIPKRTGSTRPISLAHWHAITGNFTTEGRPVFAVDATTDQRFASIVAASPGIAALAAHGAGVGWLEAKAIELARKYDTEIIVDEAGPAAFIIAGLEAADVTVHKANLREYAAACAWFKDAVFDRRVRVRADDLFTSAVDAARTRTVGDAWLWARKNVESDVSPLVACTLALYRAHRPEKSNPGLVVHFLDT